MVLYLCYYAEVDLCMWRYMKIECTTEPRNIIAILTQVNSVQLRQAIYSEACLCNHLRNRDNLEIKDSYSNP